MLSALTLRGRTLLCVGLAIIIGAAIIGERDLLRAGVLVVAIPLLAGAAMARVPNRVTEERDLTPTQVPVGGDARVHLRLTHTGAGVLSTGMLLVADELPYTLGRQPRFTIPRLRPGEGRDISYRVRARTRGRYTIGPLSVSFRDALGCLQVTRQLGSPTTLVVTPEIVALPEVRPRGEWPDSGQSRTRLIASAGEDDAIPREYRHGDDLRRVHWRSTARHGELMVRREEQEWRDHSTVLLDLREQAHAGTGASASLETAISAAGSIAVHLLRQGQGLGFITDAAEVPLRNSAETVIEGLSVVRASPGRDLHHAAELLRGASGTGPRGRGLIVAVLGAVGEQDIQLLADQGRARGQRCIALLCETAAWPAPAGLAAARTHLTRSGWQVASVASASQLPDIWRELATGPTSAMRFARSGYGTSDYHGAKPPPRDPPR